MKKVIQSIKENKKSRAIAILFIVELILLVFFTVRLFIPNKSTTYGLESFNIINGSITQDGQACELSTTGIYEMVRLDNISLPAGTYEICYNYEADYGGHLCAVEIEDSAFGFIEEVCGQLRAQNMILEYYNKEQVQNLRLLNSTDKLLIKVLFVENGSLRLNSITISETHADDRTAIALLLMLALPLNGIIWWRRKHTLNEEQKQVVFGLVCIVIASSVLLFLPYLINGHDLQFHLLRIEGVKDSILTGQLPAKVQPNWLRGNGYAVSIFYGDLFLYFPALLRIIGFSQQFSYVMYALCINAATALISYFCFKGISDSRKVGLIGSAVYTLALYRLINMYLRGAVGEYTAMTFFPLIAYGLWKIFTEEPENKGYKYNIIAPVIGYTGLIQSHVISCEIAAIVTIILCLVFVKKIFNKKRFMVLAAIVILTAIINAGFLIPFISYMGVELNINVVDYTKGIQNYGAYVAQILDPFVATSGLVGYANEGMSEEMPITTGLAVIFGAIGFVYAWYMGRLSNLKQKVTGIFCFMTGLLMMYMSTIYFPWDAIQREFAFTAKVITSFQFPWRFFVAAILLFTISMLVGIKAEQENKEHTGVKWLSVIVIAATVIQGGWFISGVMKDSEILWTYDAYESNTNFLVGGEYLPEGSEIIDYRFRIFGGSDNIQCEQTDRSLNIIEFTCNNSSNEEGIISTSLVYYPGYEAVNNANGDKLELYDNDGMVYIRVPAGTAGSYTLSFVQPWYWYVSYVISIAGAIILILMCRNYYISRKAEK